MADEAQVQPGEVREEDAGPVEGKPTEVAEVEHTLGDMVNDGFAFFTTALITTHGLFDRDPIVEFRRMNPQISDAEAPFAVDCQYPFFAGLGHGLLNGQFIDWNRRLYGIHREQWETLHRFVASLAMYDAKRYHYAKVGWHQLTIVDQTAMHSGNILTEIPRIPITVFCISGYRGFAYIEPAKDPPRTLPYLKLKPPEPELQAEAEALLGPPANPEQLAQYKEETHGETDS
jgi:hypothetical protein